MVLFSGGSMSSFSPQGDEVLDCQVETLQIAHQTGFEEVSLEDIQELHQSHDDDDELTNEQLMTVCQSQATGANVAPSITIFCDDDPVIEDVHTISVPCEDDEDRLIMVKKIHDSTDRLKTITPQLNKNELKYAGMFLEAMLGVLDK